MTLVVQYQIQKDGQRIGRKHAEYRLDGKVISAAKAIIPTLNLST